MKTNRAIVPYAIALALALSAAHADDGAEPAARLGDHPAVVVARNGVHRDPAASFYLHPARLSWSMSRPSFEGEHPPAPSQRKAPESSIGANRFIAAHPASGPLTLELP